MTAPFAFDAAYAAAAPRTVNLADYGDELTTAEWQRERPLMVALDNYAVHTSQTVEAARPQLAAAGVQLVPLARYCPEQSGIEPIWNDIKQHHLPIRSFAHVVDLKRAVDAALTDKASQLNRTSEKPTNVPHLST